MQISSILDKHYICIVTCMSVIIRKHYYYDFLPLWYVVSNVAVPECLNKMFQ